MRWREDVRPGWRRMWSSTARPRHPPTTPTTPRRCTPTGGRGQQRLGKNGRRRRHWVGGFTFIPFSSPARCLPNTESPQDGLTGGAAIDLPVIMGVTQEATCLQKKKLPACSQLISTCSRHWFNSPEWQSCDQAFDIRKNWIPFVGFKERSDSYTLHFSDIKEQACFLSCQKRGLAQTQFREAHFRIKMGAGSLSRRRQLQRIQINSGQYVEEQ